MFSWEETIEICYRLYAIIQYIFLSILYTSFKWLENLISILTKWNIWIFRFIQSISIIDFLLWMKNETIIWQCLKKFSDANKLFEGQGALIVCFPKRQPWGYATDLHHSSVNNPMHSAQSKCSASVFSKEFSCVYNSGLRMDIGRNTWKNSSMVC